SFIFLTGHMASMRQKERKPATFASEPRMCIQIPNARVLRDSAPYRAALSLPYEVSMPQNWTMPSPLDAFILPDMRSRSPSRVTQVRPKPSAKAASTRAKKIAAPVTTPLQQDDDGPLCECLRGICSGEQRALERLYDLTVSRVYSVALRVARRDDLAEEVVSDVYVQVWRNASRYDTERGRVMGWLLIIARTRALDLLRRQDEAFSHPEPYDLVSEPESRQAFPEELLAAAQAGSALHNALEKINPVQRQLLSLAFFRGLTHAEIVEHTGMPLGTVKTHIRRALDALRKTLGPAAEAGELL
ncbi:MAG: sigma-70 family RNA polymerase sigma factor, partial [Usitatibacteraceae bacterium]